MQKLNNLLGYFQLIGFSIILLIFSVYKISEGIEEAIYTLPFGILLFLPFILIAFLALRKQDRVRAKLNFYLNTFLVFVSLTGLVLLLFWSDTFNYGLLVLIVIPIYFIFQRRIYLKLLLIYLLGCSFILFLCALVFIRYLQFSLY